MDCSDSELQAMEPDSQWQMLEKIDAVLTTAGITPALENAIASGGSVDLSVAAAVDKRKRAEEEEEEEQAAIQFAATKAAEAKKHEEAENFRLATLAEHAKKMAEDPIYKAQMTLLMAQVESKQPQPSASVASNTGSASSNAQTKAKENAQNTVAKLKANVVGTVGVRRSPPQISEQDLVAPQEDAHLTWEQKADKALELAKRSAVTSSTALVATQRVDAARQPTMMAFLPSGTDPRELSEALTWWFQQGWISLEHGVVWLAARSTPARFGLTCEIAYGAAVSALNWCSGNSIRCVMDTPSEINQQKTQFRDFLNFSKQMFAEASAADDPVMELELCRPHRRSRTSADSETEDTADWWSLAYVPREQVSRQPVCFVRCEYHHSEQWMRYKIDPAVLYLWRMGRAELEKHIGQQATYYLFDTKVIGDLQQIRTQKQETVATRGDQGPPAPAALMAAPVGAQPVAPPQPLAFDPWAQPKGKGKGGKKGKGKFGDGKFGGKSKGDGKSKGSKGGKRGKSSGKPWETTYEHAFGGANTPWWMR